MSVLLTRSREDSARMARDLADRGIETLIWPLSRIEHLDAPASIPDMAEAVVLTSANAVPALPDTRLPVYCVGRRTAEAARQAGLGPVHSADGDVGDLVRLIAGEGPGTVFYPRGQHVAQDLAGLLAPSGCRVLEQVVYRSGPGGAPESVVATALREGRIEAITIWSRRNGEILRDHLAANPDWRIGGSVAVGISQNALEPLCNAGFARLIAAERPDAGAMADAISAALRQ